MLKTTYLDYIKYIILYIFNDCFNIYTIVFNHMYLLYAANINIPNFGPGCYSSLDILYAVGFISKF